jgi:tripartite ATP-independent transporter DctM subunit
MFAFLIFVFIGTLIVGVPVAFGMGLAGAGWIIFFEGIEPTIIARRLYFALDSFPLLAVPLFVMMGYLAERSGLLPEMVRWLQLLLGRVRGGMAYVNVGGSMLMAGVSGTAVSDIASLGRLEIQMMTRAGYPLPFSAALTAASSVIGPIIPPSVSMIIYALAVGQVSIGALFMAGVLPGLLIALGLAAISWWKARSFAETLTDRRAAASEIGLQTLRVIPLMLLPMLIVGGITLGLFTVTESAAVGMIYTLAIGLGWTRKLRVRDIYGAAVYAAVISSVVGLLMGAGAILAWVLTLNRATHALAEIITNVSTDPTVLLVMVAGALLVAGMFLDAVPLIIALAPLLAPIARRYGIDDLQFAMVFILSSIVGLVTPPVGIILFMTSGISGVSAERLSAALLPFVAWMICVVAITAFVPGVSLWLPRALGF